MIESVISYMIDNDGYLIVNRDIVSTDIDDFDILQNQNITYFRCLMKKMKKHYYVVFLNILEMKDHIVMYIITVTFLIGRSSKNVLIHGLDMRNEIGVWKDRTDVYIAIFTVNIDYSWFREIIFTARITKFEGSYT